MRTIALILLPLLFGCSARTKLGKIAIMEFAADENVTTVANFNKPINAFGMDLAKRVAEELRDKHRDAVAVPRGQEPEADTVVSARITRIDGGSRGKRVLVSTMLGFGLTDYGMGGAYCAVDGVVFRHGQPFGTFSVDYREKSTGYFWVRYGDSASHQIEGC